MVNQKIVDIASQTAAEHMGKIIKNIYQENDDEETTVYFDTFQTLLNSCNITSEILTQRVTEWVEINYQCRDPKGIVGSLIKSSTNANMGQKIFKKLVCAVFPAE